jgi:glycosyltransferase involved in cell wall biosynthesis
MAKKAKIPKILYIGPGTPNLESIKYYHYEDTSLDIHYTDNDNNIEELLLLFKPDAIVTIGESDTNFPNLYKQPFEVRKKWINLSEVDSETGQKAYYCAINQILNLDNSQLISYFTPIYNTGEKLYKTYESLVNQTYQNWEWVLVNDSTDDITLKIAEEIAAKDYRVTVYDFKEKSKGNIGEVKYRAAMLCKGYLLAELDHDDLLTENCTQDLYNASQTYPDAGFFFTDWVEIDEQGNSLAYSDGWGCGYGKYYQLNNWSVCDQHNINPKTIRHIVGIPNHVRAWRRDTYLAIGGHNRDLTIADDYELVVRTFLKTKFCKIPKLGYIQIIYKNETEQNSHDVARADIQRRVRSIADYYNEAIKNRFEELGVKDWVYEANNYDLMAIPSRYGEEEGYVNYIF